MIRDITLGQYYPADSILHKLDPRVKLVTTLVFLTALFLVSSWWGYLAATLFLAWVIRLSKVPFKFMIPHNLLFRPTTSHSVRTSIRKTWRSI